jgi:histidinol dehydrogenase
MVEVRQLHFGDDGFKSSLDSLLRREADNQQQRDIHAQVSELISMVRTKGDEALIDLSRRFDRCDLGQLGIELDQMELESALSSIDVAQRSALEYAADRIRDYHQHQMEKSWSINDGQGNVLGQKITPLKRVGLYVPGGKAAYPSSVLMNSIPAKVAGVEELIVTTPAPDGKVNPVVLAAAAVAGVDRVFRVGGAQAIAALAFGTESIPAVDKITGPGNAWVAAAKQQVFGRVGIDMIAGPSEVLIIADRETNPDWVAMDLFAQAEHDELAQAILLTQDAGYVEAVQESIDRLLPTMERKEIIQAALRDHGAFIVVSNQQELVDVADTIAAEHLEIFVANASELAEQISNAGAIFIGPYSAESLGDYCAGPNHVLPTSGTARFSSPLGVYDFLKRTSIIQMSPEGSQQIARNASVLARSEQLTAHARAAELRMQEGGEEG